MQWAVGLEGEWEEEYILLKTKSPSLRMDIFCRLLGLGKKKEINALSGAFQKNPISQSFFKT